MSVVSDTFQVVNKHYRNFMEQKTCFEQSQEFKQKQRIKYCGSDE